MVREMVVYLDTMKGAYHLGGDDALWVAGGE